MHINKMYALKALFREHMQIINLNANSIQADIRM